MSHLNKFIEDKLALQKKHYREDPASIIEHFNIEQQNIQTYNGRQLLERLQNADDASETAKKKKVLIRLSKSQLTIANNGFTFVARQKRISFDGKHFWIDLVFYNRFLKYFVLIDLKIGELKHQDLGQMQMYVNYYDREVRLEDENKTIGIVLCRDKSESVGRIYICQKITNTFLQVNIKQFYQVKTN